MKRLFKKLPPFAPDYSGVCSALFELGGLAVILDASGCTGNYTGYDEPRWYDGTGNVLCSSLRELDAVLGDETKLIQKIQAYLGEQSPQFIALLGSPAPMVIGMDYQAVANEVGQYFGLPTFSFDTSGMYTYERGASQGFLEIAKRFVKPPSQKRARGINILGATPLDLSAANVAMLRQLLEREDIEVVSCWSMGSYLETLSYAAEASVNLVVSSTGLATARYLENCWGIPYQAGLPVGRTGLRWLKQIQNGLDAGLLNFGAELVFPTHSTQALVIGEQLSANSIRHCLQADLGFGQVDVASYFQLDPVHLTAGDRQLEEEADLTVLTKAKEYDLIIGDPLFKPLTVQPDSGVYLGLPHYAVSSKIYRTDHRVFLGEPGLELLASALNRLASIKDE